MTTRQEEGEARSLGEERAETTSGHGLRESPSPIDTQRRSRDVISRMEEHLAGSVLTTHRSRRPGGEYQRGPRIPRTIWILDVWPLSGAMRRSPRAAGQVLPRI
ncbi:hypothetical protein MRX96_005140 [Rhipicephalus microplus]